MPVEINNCIINTAAINMSSGTLVGSNNYVYCDPVTPLPVVKRPQIILKAGSIYNALISGDIEVILEKDSKITYCNLVGGAKIHAIDSEEESGFIVEKHFKRISFLNKFRIDIEPNLSAEIIYSLDKNMIHI